MLERHTGPSNQSHQVTASDEGMEPEIRIYRSHQSRPSLPLSLSTNALQIYLHTHTIKHTGRWQVPTVSFKWTHILEKDKHFSLRCLSINILNYNKDLPKCILESEIVEQMYVPKGMKLEGVFSTARRRDTPREGIVSDTRINKLDATKVVFSCQ